MLTNLFIRWGWSRNDLKWILLQISTVAALISSNVFDVPYWCGYLGIPLSPTVLHWIFALSALVLWVAGRYNASPLPSANAMASGTVPNSPVAKADDKIDLSRLGPLILILAFSAGAVGCATTNLRHIATVSAVAAHSTLAAVQDTEMLLVCGKPSAPAPPACVDAIQHWQNSAKLVTAFDADIQVHTAIRDWPALGPAPTSIGTWLGQITIVVNYVLDHLPEGILTTKLLTQIGASK